MAVAPFKRCTGTGGSAQRSPHPAELDFKRNLSASALRSAALHHEQSAGPLLGFSHRWPFAQGTGWKPMLKYQEGLAATVAWFSAEPELVRACQKENKIQ